jgi:hypothetical protein
VAFHKASPLVCCLNDRDRQAVTDLVTPLAYHPTRMAMDQRKAAVGERYAYTRCTYCGKLRTLCVGGCDLIPVTVWKVPD